MGDAQLETTCWAAEEAGHLSLADMSLTMCLSLTIPLPGGEVFQKGSPCRCLRYRTRCAGYLQCLDGKAAARIVICYRVCRTNIGVEMSLQTFDFMVGSQTVVFVRLRFKECFLMMSWSVGFRQ